VLGAVFNDRRREDTACLLAVQPTRSPSRLGDTLGPPARISAPATHLARRSPAPAAAVSR
jgi:hypothetical protein